MDTLTQGVADNHSKLHRAVFNWQDALHVPYVWESPLPTRILYLLATCIIYKMEKKKLKTHSTHLYFEAAKGHPLALRKFWKVK